MSDTYRVEKRRLPSASSYRQRRTHWLSCRVNSPILSVDEDNRGLKCTSFITVEVGVSNDNDLVSGQRQTRSSSIKADDPRTGRSLNHVSRESGTCINIVNIDSLIDEESGSLNQIAINRNRSLIMQVRLGNLCT